MNWFRRFMIGRYGSDQLSMALMGVWVLISILSRFIRNPIMNVFYMIMPIIIFYRIFSKNISKRHEENIKFLNLWNPIKYKVKNKVQRVKDLKYYRYYKCPNCRQTLRVPRGKGRISITCPKCRNVIVRKS